MLYKILNKLPEEAKKDGSIAPDSVLPLIPLDLKDGFIHLSTKEQVSGSLNKFYSEPTEVIILEIDAPDNKDTVPEVGKTGNRDRSQLKWEYVESRKQHFPHIYGDLINSDIVGHKILKRTGSEWTFP